MKKIILIIYTFFAVINLYALEPKLRLILDDASSKVYNLNEISKINFFKGTDICLVKIFYQDSLMSSYQTTAIEQIKFERDNFNNDLLSVYYSGKSSTFLIAEIDSINFYITKLPVAQINSITPSSGKIGDLVIIDGSNFGTSQGSSILSFKGKNASDITLWSDNQIKVKVPIGCQSGPVSVTTNGIKSNEVDFNIIHNLNSLSPAFGRPGDIIKISGSNFGNLKEKNFASFNDINAVEYLIWSDTAISVKVPQLSKTGKVTVTIGSLKSNSLDFIILPTIFKISPTIAKIGDTLTISGFSFGTPKDTVLVYFNDKKAPNYLSMNDSTIKVIIPVGTRNGKLYITSKNLKSNEVDFSILPQISKLNPNSNSIGLPVNIIGSGFGDSTSTSKVIFSNNTITKFNKRTDTEIAIIVPDGTISGKVSVNSNGNKSNEVDFTVLHNLLSIAPKAQAKIGDEITIIGTSFGTSQGSSSVSINNIKVNDIKSWSDNEIKFNIPVNTITGMIAVTINGVKSNELLLSIIPEIKTITPTSASYGSSVTITGTGFNDTQNNGFVAFTRVNATEYLSWNSTTIVVKVPNGCKSGKLSVKASEQKSNEVDFAVLFSLIGIAPSSGFVGDQITLVGISFGDTQGTSFVSFNGTNVVEYISWTNEEIKVKVPAGATSGKVSVTVGGVKSNESDFTLTPQINNINPTSNYINYPVTISGINFGSSRGTSFVKFNGVVATSYTNWSNNSITVNVPVASSGKVSVTVNSITSNEVDFIINSVVVGNQEWMVKNLEVTNYRNGDAIPECTDQTQWNNLTTGAWCYYNNTSSNGETYGKLYNWYAVNDPRGLAPVGWHVPTESEWTTLTNYVSNNGGALKEAGTSHWNTPNTNATNDYGFSALPGGYRMTNFDRLRDVGIFWTASANDATTAWSFNFFYNNTTIGRNAQSKALGFSVRCIKD